MLEISGLGHPRLTPGRGAPRTGTVTPCRATAPALERCFVPRCGTLDHAERDAIWEAARRAIQDREESVRALAKRYSISPDDRAEVAQADHRRRCPNGTEDGPLDRPVDREKAIIVDFRRHTLLPLDDYLYALQPTIRT